MTDWSAAATGAPPDALALLLSSWRSFGMPTQPGVAWPRHRWIDAFPQHTDLLRALPDRLDRAAVRGRCAGAAFDGHSAEEAFITVMAWGYGVVGYGPFRTRRVLGESRAPDRLASVLRTLADTGAAAAYSRLARMDDCRLSGLGPAFGTKYLYFCQPAGQQVVALILDDLVSTWLRREAHLRLGSGMWSERTYRTYLGHMHDWARGLGCASDELEYCIFQAMASERGNQWGASQPAPKGFPQ